jgi:hypothetical protein
MAKPFPARAKARFLQRLLIAADEYSEADPAAEYLREDVRHQLEQVSGARWVISYHDKHRP